MEDNPNIKSLQINTGVVTYRLNDTFDLSFNPTDAEYIEGLYRAFEELDQKQDAYKAEVAAAQNSSRKSEIFEIARRWDKEMRKLVDDALGAPVCDAVFGKINVYALADGLPLWANLLLALLDEIDTSVTQNREISNKKIAKYTQKYKRNK